jgi:hypothetical protein
MELGSVSAETATTPKPSIWALWLRADTEAPWDASSRSLLFRRLLREHGYVTPGGAPMAGPVCELHGADCVPGTCL